MILAGELAHCTGLNMSTKKVDIIHSKLYGVDSKIIPVGIQEVEAKLADQLVKKGLAKEVEVKTKK